MNLKNADRRLITILLIVFVQMLGAAMILPILPLYARSEFGLPDWSIPLLVSAFFAAQFLAGPYLGKLSDEYGRVPILILSQIGTVISFLMLAVAPNAWVLFAARIIDGITGGNIIVAQAYITDITPREKRSQALGYIFGLFGLGFVLGPALGGLLSRQFGPRLPYVIASVAAAVVVLLTWLTLDETVDKEAERVERATGQRRGISPAEILANYPLILVLLVGFVGQFALGMLQSTFALYGEDVLFAGYSNEDATLGVGLLLAVVGLGQLLTQVALLRRALSRFGEARLVVVGNLVRAVGLLIFAVVTSPYLAGAGSLFFAVGMGLMMPPLQSLATYTVSEKRRGGVLGVYQSVVSLSTIISTALGGFIFDLLSPTAPYWVGAAICLLALIPAFLLIRQAETQGWEEVEETPDDAAPTPLPGSAPSAAAEAAEADEEVSVPTD